MSPKGKGPSTDRSKDLKTLEIDRVLAKDKVALRQSLDSSLVAKRMRKYHDWMTDLTFKRTNDSTGPRDPTSPQMRNQGVSIVSKTMA